MMRSSRVDKILSTLAEGSDEPGTLPERLCNACAEALPVSGVGLALMTASGHGGEIAATDGPARALEDLQLSLGEGPGMDASREGRPVLEPDLALSAFERWQAFTPAVLESGVAAIFALPLQVGGIRLGVLSLYRSTPGSLDDEQLRLALAYAEAAVVILLRLQRRTDPEDGLHPALDHPIDDRTQIHQATGMVSVQAGVGLQEALLLLRAHAYAAERPVLDDARDVVTRQLRFTPEDDHHE